MEMMTARQRVLRAVSPGKGLRPDKVPKDLSWGFTPAVMQTFQQMTGQDSPEEYFGIDVRFVGFDPPPDQLEAINRDNKHRFRNYFQGLPDDSIITEWGTAHLPGDYYHFTRLISPMQSFNTLVEFERFPLPRFDESWRLAHADALIESFHQQDLAVCGAMAVTIFEVAWQLRGMEELFSDFIFRPELGTFLLDALTDIRCNMARFFAQKDVDVLILGDDVSMQTGMLMSPKTWRQWFKGRMRRIIETAHAVKPNLPIFYHSDGNPEAIIPDLIEIGVTILNPVQPECINPVKVKQQFGDQLALWGTIGTQTTMPFGTPEDVRREVKTRIETVGREGGLLLGPTHSLEPDVPWENIVALYQAIDEFGTYA